MSVTVLSIKAISPKSSATPPATWSVNPHSMIPEPKYCGKRGHGRGAGWVGVSVDSATKAQRNTSPVWRFCAFARKLWITAKRVYRVVSLWGKDLAVTQVKSLTWQTIMGLRCFRVCDPITLKPLVGDSHWVIHCESHLIIPRLEFAAFVRMEIGLLTAWTYKVHLSRQMCSGKWF